MQVLIDLFAGFIALIAAAALAQFGVILDSPRSDPSRQTDREIRRVVDCHPTPTGGPSAPRPSSPC